MDERTLSLSRAAQAVTAAVFCLFLAGLGLAHVLLPDRTFSPVENRNLSQMPAFSWRALAEGDYTAALETYLADQFPGRDGWMGMKTRYEALLGKREFHGVYLCGDRLISKVEDAGRAESNMDYLRRLGEKAETPVYLGLIPTAAEIWRDRLPEGAESFDQRAYLERVRAACPGLEWVDIGGALAEHAGEEIYYRTDHHWTSLGAYWGSTPPPESTGWPPTPSSATRLRRGPRWRMCMRGRPAVCTQTASWRRRTSTPPSWEATPPCISSAARRPPAMRSCWWSGTATLTVWPPF